MKCMLIMPRWSEYESLSPPSGRPYLDLQLQCLGFLEIGFSELEPDAPFDPATIPEAYRLILVQDYHKPTSKSSSGRLRRSLLSNLGLSLGLDSDESDRLHVMGARSLRDADGIPSGFAIQRRGRIVVYCEKNIWELREELFAVIRALLNERTNETFGSSRRGQFNHCWMVEGSGTVLDLQTMMTETECNQCQSRILPSGDTALLIPANMGVDFQDRLQTRLENRLYSKTPQPLEILLNEQFQETGVKVAVAESCTGGMVGTRLSAVPGSSVYFTMGYVTYANYAKSNSLDINPVLIERCGAVSPEVALAMARGALRNSSSNLAVSTTGVAGPDGGTSEKPVGTVYLAAVSDNGDVLEHHGFYHGNRDRIRYQTSQTALHLLRRLLITKIA